MRRKPFHHVDYLVNICRSIGAEPLSGTLAFDPRNDVDRCAFAISRRIAPEVLQIARPQKEEGARKTGCALHSRSRVQTSTRKLTRAYRFSGNTPAFPAPCLH